MLALLTVHLQFGDRGGFILTRPVRGSSEMAMRNSVCQPIVRELFDHLDRGESYKTERVDVPARDYWDPTALAAEQRRLFSGMPQAVAISADLPGPGSYLTRDLFSVPLVVIRGEDGTVGAFANVCSHRGSQVVPDGRGKGRRFACPYHGWTYDTGGDLVAVPDSASFPDVCVPGQGMPPLPAVEENGVVWVYPPGALATMPTDRLGAIADDFDNFGIDAYRYWRSHRFELDLNWKLVIDTFLEGYHFSSLHRDTVAKFFLPNIGVAERFGHNVRAVLPRKSLLELRDQAPEDWDVVPHSAMVYLLFPSTVLVMQIDHIETWRVVPDPNDPTKSTAELDFFVPDEPPTDETELHWEKNWKVTIDTVINEDFAAMASVQRGASSGMIDTLRIGANEPGLGFFHQAYADVMAEQP